MNNQVRQRGPEFTDPKKLVCADLQPYGSTQAPDRSDVRFPH